MTQIHATDRERARAEAADWCVRINAGGDQLVDLEFERWLALNPLNRELFSEMSELHRFGAALRPGIMETPAVERRQHQQDRGRLMRAGITALIIGGLTIASAAVIIATSRQVPEFLQSKRDAGIISLASASQRRTFHLNDGSTVIMDADSRVTVSIDGRSRQLMLEKGRARFEVAHDGRPFTVRAGRGSVRALGTIFDVSILNDQSVRVDLLRGSVEIKTSYRSGKSPTEQRKRLAAGESAEFGGDGAMQRALVSRSVASRLWPEGLVTYNGTELGAVLAQANRYGDAGFKLRAADSATSRRTVYGTLKIDDPQQLAQVLARSLDLEVAETSTGISLSQK